MKITYIEHSGFSVETDVCSMVFDYYKGDIPDFDKSKQVLVFASHKHHDHFTPEIFKLAEQYPHIVFILSKDIKRSVNTLGDTVNDLNDKIIYMRKVDNLELTEGLKSPVEIETLRSNDAGVAFIVNVGGKCIYHAGDLNWWDWEGEEEETNKKLTQEFLTEIRKIKGRSFDLAFLPLDPRLEQNFYLGLNHFMEQTDTKYVFPMHLWGDYSVIAQLKSMDCAASYKDRVQSIERSGQEFFI